MDVNGKILVADDEPHIRRILEFLLTGAGYEVHFAEDGQQAIEAIGPFNPDLVLLDVMMPKLDGYSVLEKIRSGLDTSRIPVIMLTAKGETEDRLKGLGGGANDYVSKPFDQEELLLRVKNLLQATRSEREANPLTGLPGNRAIEAETVSRLSSGQDFAFMYLDIDRFKSFNDYYGYARGDRGISFLADVLRICSRQYGSDSDFIGHVGGDDFVMITATEGSETLAMKIIEEFDGGIGNLHEPEDFEKGYLEVVSRSGGVNRHPLITLTVALVCEANGRFLHPAQISDTMAELKRYGKSMDNSVLVRERRTPEGAKEFLVTEASYSSNGHPTR